MKPGKNDCFGFIKHVIDAHVLGINAVTQLLTECGFNTIVADTEICSLFSKPESDGNMDRIAAWIRKNRVTILGFSYRLDPGDGVEICSRIIASLRSRCLYASSGAPLKAFYFAGLPETCYRVKKQNPEINGIFTGDETPEETLGMFSISPALLPPDIKTEITYDHDRFAFGKEIIAKGDYLGYKAPGKSGYPGFGTRNDTIISRIEYAREKNSLPITRAHCGPYLTERAKAVSLFLMWVKTLSETGYLDVLSIGTSQLSQSNFGENWDGMLNGGGVPVNSGEEYASIWQASRPMLVRTYAGTKNIRELAELYESTINIAWHALSFWWFCQVDGRGPYTVLENLTEQLIALQYIASTGKPFEANIPHHFAFRGADDVTYIVSAVVAALTAKSFGIKYFIIQNMLATPKSIPGICDLAKSRILIKLIKELESPDFRVIVQTRGGLDYFSHDTNKARIQLSAVTALMDDIEPFNRYSPEIIHVVSYSEAAYLADPPVIDESIKITLHSLHEYRRLRKKGWIDDMSKHQDVSRIAGEIEAEARMLLQAIKDSVPGLFTPQGLYRIFTMGFLSAPYLAECREEFAHAVSWNTRLLKGRMRIVDEGGNPMTVKERIERIKRWDQQILIPDVQL